MKKIFILIFCFSCFYNYSKTQIYNFEADSFINKYKSYENQATFQKYLNSKGIDVSDQYIKYIKNKSGKDTAIYDTIVLAFHILVYDSIQKLYSDSAIAKMLDIIIKDLNEAYSGRTALNTDIEDYFKLKNGNPHIFFMKAKTDPYGNSTTGFTRVSTSSLELYSDVTANSIDNVWDPRNYLNVYLNNRGPKDPVGIANTLGAKKGTDRMIHVYFSKNGAESQIVIHEIGHFLGLPHTFEACSGLGAENPSDINIQDAVIMNDELCNFPSTNTLCDKSKISTEMYNFMSYSSCGNSNRKFISTFTKGQSFMMQNALYNVDIIKNMRLSNRFLAPNQRMNEPFIVSVDSSNVQNTCDSIQLGVNIKNIGGNNISSMMIGVYYSDTIFVNSFLWNGNLGIGQTINIPLGFKIYNSNLPLSLKILKVNNVEQIEAPNPFVTPSYVVLSKVINFELPKCPYAKQFNDIKIIDFNNIIDVKKYDSMQLRINFQNNSNIGLISSTSIKIYQNYILTDSFIWTGKPMNARGGNDSFLTPIIKRNGNNIKIVLEKPNGVKDTDTSNNELTKSITKPMINKYDMAILNYISSAQCDSFQITPTVQNLGTVASSGAYVRYYQNNKIVSEDNIKSLNPGEIAVLNPSSFLDNFITKIEVGQKDRIDEDSTDNVFTFYPNCANKLRNNIAINSYGAYPIKVYKNNCDSLRFAYSFINIGRNTITNYEIKVYQIKNGKLTDLLYSKAYLNDINIASNQGIPNNGQALFVNEAFPITVKDSIAIVFGFPNGIKDEDTTNNTAIFFVPECKRSFLYNYDVGISNFKIAPGANYCAEENLTYAMNVSNFGKIKPTSCIVDITCNIDNPAPNNCNKKNYNFGCNFPDGNEMGFEEPFTNYNQDIKSIRYNNLKIVVGKDTFVDQNPSNDTFTSYRLPCVEKNDIYIYNLTNQNSDNCDSSTLLFKVKNFGNKPVSIFTANVYVGGVLKFKERVDNKTSIFQYFDSATITLKQKIKYQDSLQVKITLSNIQDTLIDNDLTNNTDSLKKLTPCIPKIPVTFMPQNGDKPTVKYANNGEIIEGTQNSLIKNNFNFIGWSTTTLKDNIIDLKKTPIINPMVFYAIWKSNKMNVTFYLNGGEGQIPPQQIIEQSANATAPSTPIPTRIGYYFVCWSDNLNATQAFEAFNFKKAFIIKDTSIYAIWKKQTSILIFDSNYNANGVNGSVLVKSLGYNESYNAPLPILTRRGFIFKGWSLKYNDSNLVDVSKFQVKENTKLYAVWTPKVNIVKFNINNENISIKIDSQIVQSNKTATIPQTPNVEGYIFSHWSTNKLGLDTFLIDKNVIVSDTILYAIWKVNIQYDLNGFVDNSFVLNSNVIYGNKLIKPNNPKIIYNGYTFKYWSLNKSGNPEFNFDTTKITKPLKIYAYFAIDTFKVTFESNGGLPIYPDQPVTYKGLVTQPNPNPSIKNQKFIGWGKDNPITGSIVLFNFNNYLITNNITLMARYLDSNQNMLSFNLNYPTTNLPPAFQVDKIGADINPTKPTDPTRQGYKFIMWGNTINSIGADSFIFSNYKYEISKTVYAIWQAQTNTLTFNINGGTSTAPATQNITSGNKGTKPTDPTRQGYKFIMWGNTINSSGADSFSFSNKIIDTNYTVYAIWQAQTNTLTFNINGGTSTAPATQNITSGNKGTKPADPSRQGYKFIMWGNTINSSGADSFSFSNKVIDTNYTVYAIWQALNSYTLTFNINGGTSTAPATKNITSGNKGTKPADPTRQGYKFIMWGNTINSSGADSFSFSNKVIDANYTVYAIWQALNSYTLTFNINGGTSTAPATQNITSGNKGTKPADPTKQGYKFIMWGNTINSSGADSFSFNNKIIDTNYTVYAIWQAQTNTLTFNINGGTSTAPATQNITSGNKGTKPADPTRQGYKFIMWGNTINSSGADSFSFSNKIIDTNYTVYAIWQALNSYTLTFNINGGTSTAPATQNITSGNKGTKPADPTKQGYKFIMWGNTINSSGADSFSFSNKVIDTNYTVYAIWEINLDYIDVSLDSIVGPFNCDSFKLKIATTNKSQVALTKMEINVYINNKLTETYLWTGNLKLNEKTIIEMKNSVIKIRDKIIKVIISKPNDVIDKNPIDNESIKTKDDCMLQVPDFKNSKPDLYL